MTSLLNFSFSHAAPGNASIIISSLSHETIQTLHISLWLKDVKLPWDEHDSSYGFTNSAFGWYPCSRHDEGFSRCMWNMVQL